MKRTSLSDLLGFFHFRVRLMKYIIGQIIKYRFGNHHSNSKSWRIPQNEIAISPAQKVMQVETNASKFQLLEPLRASQRLKIPNTLAMTSKGANDQFHVNRIGF